MEENRYLAAQTVSDVWICYPWEATYAEDLEFFYAYKLTIPGILTSMISLQSHKQYNNDISYRRRVEAHCINQ